MKVGFFIFLMAALVALVAADSGGEIHKDLQEQGDTLREVTPYERRLQKRIQSVLNQRQLDESELQDEDGQEHRALHYNHRNRAHNMRYRERRMGRNRKRNRRYRRDDRRGYSSSKSKSKGRSDSYYYPRRPRRMRMRMRMRQPRPDFTKFPTFVPGSTGAPTVTPGTPTVTPGNPTVTPGTTAPTTQAQGTAAPTVPGATNAPTASTGAPTVTP